ncbi:MAG: glycosyltransferase [Myxococcota bacterium]
MTRVLVVTTSFPRHASDAAGAFLVPLCRALQANGCEVRVMAPHAAGPLDDVVEGVPAIRVRYAPVARETLFYGAGAPVRLARELGVLRGGLLSGGVTTAFVRGILGLRRDVDVVYAHWLVPAGLAAVVARALGGPPVVLHAHGSDVRLLQRVPGGGLLTRMMGTRVEGVVAPSEELARATEVVLGRNVTVLPLPVMLSRSSASFPRHDVGFLGRLIPQKGVDVLLRAAARGTLSVLVGGDGPERRSLEQQASASGAKVTFAGMVAPSDRAAFMRAITVLAVPSVSPEGAPAVVAEAQGCGVPVVASRTGGLVEMVDAACLVPPGDDVALADALGRVVMDAAWREELQRDQRRRAQTRNPDVLGPQYAALLRAATA